jgi:hypothetical protein
LKLGWFSEILKPFGSSDQAFLSANSAQLDQPMPV